MRGIFTKKHVGAFKRSISNDVLAKASMIALVSLLLVCGGTFLLCVLEPDCTFIQLLFEQVSAFGTVGLSTGITPGLCDGSKLVLINRSATPYDDQANLIIHEKIGEVFAQV